MQKFKYECNLGVARVGHIQKVIEGQGTDVTYIMKSECGKTHVLSGRLLKIIERES